LHFFIRKHSYRFAITKPPDQTWRNEREAFNLIFSQIKRCKAMQKITKVCMTGLFCLIMTVFSCQKVDKVLPFEAKTTVFKVEDVKVEDGILVFSSQKHFDNVIENLKKQNDPVHFESLTSFESMHEKRQAISNLEYEKMAKGESLGSYSDILYIYEAADGKRFEPIINDLFFESIVNSKGLVKIGKDFYKIGEKFVYKFKKENLQTISQNETIDGGLGVEKLKVE
jgi:hypothetical protein